MYPGPTPWTVRSSFVSPVPIPDAAPGDTPRTCVSFSSAWLPLVIGALLQLAQPAAWDTADDSARNAVLLDVQDLLERFGVAGGCMQLRWNPDTCAIEQSTDDGATWTAIEGWDLTGVQGCVMGGLSIRIDPGGNLQWSIDGGSTWTNVDGWSPGTPPNPQGASTSQEACNIATWLAQDIIQGALVSAIDSFDASISAGAAAAAVIALIPVFGPEIALTIEAAVGITYLIYTTGSIGDYRTASTDPTLAKDLQCAIYTEIIADGAVTADNYSAVAAAIHGIGYTPSDVQDAIDNFISSLGMNGLLAAQQLGGLTTGDCAGCIAPTPGGSNCAVFNGTNDYLEAAATIMRSTNGPFTIMAWVKMSAPSSGSYGPLFWSLATDFGNEEIFWWLPQSGGNFSPMNIGGFGGTSDLDNNSGGSAALGTWVHVAYTCTGGQSFQTGGQPYINGSSVSGTGALFGAFGASGHAPGTSWVGHDARNNLYYNGKMADFRIYQQKLTSTQIAAIHAGGVTGYVVEGSAQHWWPFNDASGSTALDYGTSTKNLTWHGSGSHWGTT